MYTYYYEPETVQEYADRWSKIITARLIAASRFCDNDKTLARMMELYPQLIRDKLEEVINGIDAVDPDMGVWIEEEETKE